MSVKTVHTLGRDWWLDEKGNLSAMPSAQFDAFREDQILGADADCPQYANRGMPISQVQRERDQLRAAIQRWARWHVDWHDCPSCAELHALGE